MYRFVDRGKRGQATCGLVAPKRISRQPPRGRLWVVHLYRSSKRLIPGRDPRIWQILDGLSFRFWFLKARVILRLGSQLRPALGPLAIRVGSLRSRRSDSRFTVSAGGRSSARISFNSTSVAPIATGALIFSIMATAIIAKSTPRTVVSGNFSGNKSGEKSCLRLFRAREGALFLLRFPSLADLPVVPITRS